MSTPTDENWQPKAIVFDLLTGLLNSWDLWDASTPSKTHEDGCRWRQRYLEITFGAGSYKPYEDLVRQAAAEHSGYIAIHGVEEQASVGFETPFTFDAAVTAEESGFYKPVKEAYHAILPKLGVEAEDILFVAGSAGDVEGATNAGMKVVWHNKIGLTKKGNAVPLRESRTLDDALKGYLTKREA
ncbi:hypothetical protein FOBRF1_004187 [Fusarium oxysporum]